MDAAKGRKREVNEPFKQRKDKKMKTKTMLAVFSFALTAAIILPPLNLGYSHF